MLYVVGTPPIRVGEPVARPGDRVQERLDAGEAACQCIDGDLGGKRTEKYSAGDSSLGIGIGEPVMQEREGALYAEGEKDQPSGKPFETDIFECQ